MLSIDAKKRATMRQDHVGKKIARATTETNATKYATTEKKTTTAETEAILAKRRPVERSTNGASKATKKSARPKRILYYIMKRQPTRLVMTYLKHWKWCGTAWR
jgi:hypothetical protein